jgi:hypothetical protein
MFAPGIRALAGAGLVIGSLTVGSIGSAFAAPLSDLPTPVASASSGQTPGALNGQARALRGFLFAALKPAAQLFGITTATLRQQLASGKTLAQIATTYGKTSTDVENAITAALKARLDQRVAAGKLTAARETQILNNAAPRIQKLVTTNLATLFNHAQHGRGFHHRPGQATPTATPTPSS